MRHPAQLLVCHQRIAADFRVHEGRRQRVDQFCSLEAHAWCYDCGFYVCDIHQTAKHLVHKTQLVSEGG